MPGVEAHAGGHHPQRGHAGVAAHPGVHLGPVSLHAHLGLDNAESIVQHYKKIVSHSSNGENICFM